MQPITKKLLRKSGYLTLMLGICAIGIRIATARNAAFPQQYAVPAVKSARQEVVFVLDAGHGGIDGGCSSADGIPEKGINLNIMLYLRDFLETAGYHVEVTRDSDRSIHDKGIEGIANQKSSDMDNRLAILNQYDNAVCVSIHQNQFTDPKYSGAQIFYAPTNDESESLAQMVQSQFCTFLQPDNTREIKECGKELFLCYYCKNPMVMAECGFLSNPEEAARLCDAEYQKKVAFTLYAALQRWACGCV